MGFQQLLLWQGHAEAAEELHRSTLEYCPGAGGQNLELRAAVSLARLRHDKSSRAEARPARPDLRWFTEGFDTADLKDAKALLDELT